ncbi:uncharacterized protein V1518DRAFT_418096 [Limtongia smithiae]|uniref:uncharacterized protein n=1 Tax=Limtongia smithiae TaxID=1125753 RepID=UPI0034CF145C
MSSSSEPGPEPSDAPADAALSARQGEDASSAVAVDSLFEVSELPDAAQVEAFKPLPSQPRDEEGEEAVNILELGIDPLSTESGVASVSAAEQDRSAADGAVDVNEDGDAGAVVPAKSQKHKKSKKSGKLRPARSQVDPSKLKDRPPQQTGTVFNIWYNKWSGGDREDKYASQTKADGRCNVARDSGYTKADNIPGSYFCLYFARGLCPNGKSCNYLHRLPTVTDLFNPNVDCFGRDKRADYRDDMGGVGSFMRPNRTIYIGRIYVSDDIEEVVARHFAEWGDIERIRVLNSRGVAFVTYVNEANAQFAKEAMAHQSLDHSEVLNVRWASVDPNPLAKAREQRNMEEQAAEAVRRMLPPEFLQQLQLQQGTSQALQPNKKRKL